MSVVTATLVSAAEVGTCASAKVINAQLSKEGQQLIIQGVQPGGTGEVSIRGNQSRSVGHFIRGRGSSWLCVIARFSDFKIIESASAVRAYNVDAVPACDPKRGKASTEVCDQLKRRKLSEIVSIVEASAGERILEDNMRKAFSAANYGFCKVKGGELFLCLSSFTEASPPS